MVVKSYRGLIPDGGQEKIRLTTTDGRIGYRITKFKIIRQAPTSSVDHVVKILKTKPAIVPVSSATIDLADEDILAVAALSGTAFGEYDTTIIFEQEIFNQDVYITHTDNDGSEACNYYVEMEQIKLSVAQAEVLIVKDLRKQPWTRP